MKICLIGPTHPFRGGISHYTTLLFRYLRKQHQTTFLAFSRQYPQWLFPGETDRDPSEYPMSEDGAIYLLDSMSPLSWLKVAQKIRSVNPQLVIFPWWTHFWTLPFYCIIFLVQKWTSAKILFVCHNVKEHESNFIKQACAKLILNMGDFHLVHSKEERSNLKNLVPETHVIEGFHPTYENLLGRRYSKEEARKKLKVDGKLILFFGFLRPYKGLDYLLDAMPSILEKLGPDFFLMVVGECWKDEQKYRKKAKELGIVKHLLRVNKYIPNEQINLYFSATDLVIIPYVSATGSGILQIAFGCGKPVVATRVGGLSDDVVDGETGYLVPPADSEGLAKAIIKFFVEKKGQQFIANIKKTKDRFSWDRIVDLIEKGVSEV